MKSSLRKNVLAGIFGHILECYDFTVYAAFSPILANIFFTNKDPRISLFFAFSVFALSFLVRPFGGVIFGYFGDHFGRKNTLIISMLMMSISTFLFGLLPGYFAVNILAPILLIFLRLIQGIAISGEMTTAVSYLVEHANQQQRGFVGSLAMCSACAGGVLSSAIVALVTGVLTHEQLLHWGWRCPFLLGGLIGFLGVFLRVRSQETLSYLMAKKNEMQMFRFSMFKHFQKLNYQQIFMSILLTSIMTVAYYFLIVYFNAFLIETMKQPLKTVMLINVTCQLLLAILLPLLGFISDKIGRKFILMSGIIGMILFAHLVFYLLQQHSIWLVFFGEFIFVLMLAPILATIMTALAEMFSIHNRNSSISLGYNISQAVFGGTAPFVALQLTTSTGNLYAPAWYLIIIAGIALFTLLKIKLAFVANWEYSYE